MWIRCTKWVHSLANLNQSFQGIALINGTQLITALGAEALYRAEMIAKQADIVAALSLDVLQGTPRAFDYGTYVHVHEIVYVAH